MLKIRHIFLLIILVLPFQLTAQSPAHDAKPWVFWYWMQGSVSRAGITADLEAMKMAGIGGAYLMSIKGPADKPLYQPAVNQLTPEWWELVSFAMQEAKRLGLKMGMHVSDGFALAGGPWIRPELSMQKLTWSRTAVRAGADRIQLATPPHKEDYYRDIAVFAFPAAGLHDGTPAKNEPRVTAADGADLSRLLNPANEQNFGTNEPAYVQYVFEKPFTCRTVIVRAPTNYQAQRLKISVSSDGKVWREAGRLQAPRHGWQDADEPVSHSIPPLTARYFRFIFDKTGTEPGAEDLDAAKWKPSLKIKSLILSEAPSIHQYESKNGSVWRVSARTADTQLSGDMYVPFKKMVDISRFLRADGTLDWKVPAGEWVILRMGHTSTGHRNATGGGGKGLECDKFNPEAIRLQFSGWYGAALKRFGPGIAPGTLNTFHVDSWECGSQNWSPLFRDEFKQRRGYDPLPYLAITSGLPVENAAFSEGFLYDMRKTIAELVTDRFYGTLAGEAKKHNLIFTAESVAPTMMSDGLSHYGRVDVPMGEFWLNSPTHDKPNDMSDAVSGAHIYGKNIIQAEAFTTLRMDWNEHPGNLKILQDRNYALGINKLAYHVFTHNPWTNRKPGMTLDGIGLYFQRDQTWWKPGKAWVDYATRVQALLQEGNPVTDIAVFTGEEYPRRSVLPDRLLPALPGIFGPARVAEERRRLENINQPLRQLPEGVNHSANMANAENWINPLRGYSYDSFGPDVLASAVVNNGRVVFKSGASYAFLVIPGATAMNPNNRLMSLQTLRELHRLAHAGATLLLDRQRPLAQPGMKRAPQKEFVKLRKKLWPGTPANELKVGNGLVQYTPFNQEDFTALGHDRDVYVQDRGMNGYARGIAYTHRSSTARDIYFISNQQTGARNLELSLRVSGKEPHLYDAVSGETRPCASWQQQNGRTSLQLSLPPAGSVFVIFEKRTAQRSGGTTITTNTLAGVSGNWKVQFDHANRGPLKAQTFEQLTDWSLHPDSAIRYYSGTAVYSSHAELTALPGGQAWLDLGKIEGLATVFVNGQECGTAWTPPYRVNVSAALRKGRNDIRIEMTNTWANRLIGDLRLPEADRLTSTNAPMRIAGKALYPAGLLGPVQLITESTK
ncbi:glycosyl hydrolase [Pedobacter sp. SYP-B3415]|uniref:glycosyl hydrolase n=1 Tax=Pedobacter sp. SYP-B3415 TaxID=2496641 RepID=UPI00197E2F9D|nr:glycosyl hydrolase [Pedobacter sp. SYP-B3415]